MGNWRLAPIAACLVMALQATVGSAGEITVTGEGRVAQTPDMAIIRIGVSRDAPRADSAMAAVSNAMVEVLASLQRSGVEERDVQTAGIHVGPRWRNSGGQQTISGYTASNNVSVRVRELTDLGPILDAVLADGANQMSGLTFTLSKPAKAERKARRRAVRNARAKAETIAEAAGVTLGPVMSIVEGGGSGPFPMQDMRAMSMEAAAPIAAGQAEVAVIVTATFETID